MEILAGVDKRKAYADLLLDHILTRTPLPPRDRALLTELVYGTLRWRGRIDWLLAQLLEHPLSQFSFPLRNLLRVTLYQILFLDRVPSYAAVHEGVELAKRLDGVKAGGLINAVMQRFLAKREDLTLPGSRDPVRNLAVSCSHPEWLVQKWLALLGKAEAEALLLANNQESPLTLRNNSLRQKPCGSIGTAEGSGRQGDSHPMVSSRGAH